jgi:hypothetical protein
MEYFTGQKAVSGITRISGYSGNLSQSTTVSTVTSCYLSPLSEVESSNNGFQYGHGFKAIFEPGDDVREQDKITIEGVTYLVKGTVLHDRGAHTQYLRALLIKTQA